MKKVIIACISIASLALAVHSCSKKEDPKPTPPATTTTGDTTPPPPPPPELGRNQVRFDTTVVQYQTDNCLMIAQGRWQMQGSRFDSINHKFFATFGRQPAESRTMTIVPRDPAGNSASEVRLQFFIGNTVYDALGGTLAFTRTSDSVHIRYDTIVFSSPGLPNQKISAKFRCP
jgi:hypothetical protein